MKQTQCLTGIMLICLLGGCTTASQNQYSSSEIGQQIDVDFGTVVAERTVKVQAESTGLGTGGGALAGAGIGSAFGQGSGQGYAILGGLIAGAIAGGIAEHELQNKQGIEYTITKADGHTVIIVQNIAKDDKPIQVGQRVMIQTSGKSVIQSGDKTVTQYSGKYVRVLPADNLPTEIKKPKGITVK